jgi:hypothetical protein
VSPAWYLPTCLMYGTLCDHALQPCMYLCAWIACPLHLCACLGRGASKATGLNGFSWISYSSLPFPQTQLPSAAGAESEWPLHCTPEVASFQQWVSDLGVHTLSNLGDPSAQKVLWNLAEMVCWPVTSALPTAPVLVPWTIHGSYFLVSPLFLTIFFGTC